MCLPISRLLPITSAPTLHDQGKAALLCPQGHPPYPCKDLKPFDLPKMRCFKETLKMGGGDTNRKNHLFGGRVFRCFFFSFFLYFPSFFLVHSSGLSISHSCAHVCALSFLVVCVFQFLFCFLKNFGFAVGGQRRSQRLDPHMAGLGQGAGPRLLRGSLCLKPLRISYCSSQGAGWGLTEGSLVAASPRVQATGAPCQTRRLGGCEESEPGALLPANLKFG